MKQHFFTSRGKMVLTLVFLGIVSLTTNAATSYGFYVGGVEVTTSNYTNITNSNTITSGTVKYDPSSNTLTLTNCTITRDGKDNRAIHNKSCEGLIVKFVGTNNLSAKNSSAVRFETQGTLWVASGTTTITSTEYEGIYLSNATIHIKGPGSLNVNSTSDCAIEGNLKNGNIQSWVYFSDGLSASIKGKKGDLVDLICYFPTEYDSDVEVTLKATGNSSYPNVNNATLKNVWNKEEADITEKFGPTFWFYFRGGYPVILKPFDATISENNNMVNYVGAQVYSQDIVLSARWELLLIPTLFSDSKFLLYLQNRYPSKYMTKSDMDNCTDIDISGKNITFIADAIHYFRALKKLNCSDNKLSDVFMNSNTNEALIELNCSNNQIESFSIPKNVTILDCSNNQLKSLGLYANTKLKSLTCGGNKFTTLSITNYSTLTTLNCKNSTSLTSLICSDNALTSLNVSGCSALTSIDCSNNKFTSLSITAMSKLATLDCSYNSSLTSLSCLNDAALTTLNCNNCALTSMNITGCTALSSLNCKSNLFEERLSVSGYSKLKTLNCSNNTKLTALFCHNNALTSLTVTGCSALQYLGCANNALTSLSVSGCSDLEKIVADNNQFTTLSITGMEWLSALSLSNNTKLTTLNCFDNVLSGANLDISGCTALTTLNCYKNKLTYIDLSDCTNLSTLKCHHNQLTSLDVSNNTKLSTLNCSYNSIRGVLNLQSLGSIKELDCGDNRITGITFSSSVPNLKSVICHTNCITDMGSIVNSLPNRKNESVGELKAIYPILPDEQNVITKSQVQAAYAKNWSTYQLVNGSWTLYEGTGSGITTEITPVVNGSAENTPLYNIGGQRVNNSYKGIVIEKNRKVVK